MQAAQTERCVEAARRLQLRHNGWLDVKPPRPRSELTMWLRPQPIVRA